MIFELYSKALLGGALLIWHKSGLVSFALCVIKGLMRQINSANKAELLKRKKIMFASNLAYPSPHWQWPTTQDVKCTTLNILVHGSVASGASTTQCNITAVCNKQLGFSTSWKSRPCHRKLVPAKPQECSQQRCLRSWGAGSTCLVFMGEQRRRGVDAGGEPGGGWQMFGFWRDLHPSSSPRSEIKLLPCQSL